MIKTNTVYTMSVNGKIKSVETILAVGEEE
jgi:hypothetical protein